MERRKVGQPSRENHGPTHRQPDCGKPCRTEIFVEGSSFVPGSENRKPQDVPGYKLEFGVDNCGQKGWWFMPMVELPPPGGGFSKDARRTRSQNMRNGR
jgi:hypothetical protein